MASNVDDKPNKKLKPVSPRRPPPAALLDDEYYDDVNLTEAYVGKVRDKRYIKDAIQEMKTALPMPKALSHLKRVRGDEIILALASECTKIACLEIVTTKLNYLETTICTCQVPAKGPKTKAQHSEANSYWPCNFHPSKMIEQLISDTFFSNEEVEKLYEYMSIAVDVARKDESPGGAVIVNGKTGAVVAAAFDERAKNPSQHAAIMAIDKVAEAQRILFRDRRPKSQDRSMELEDAGNVDTEDDLPYLCTGYDMFVTREPCFMCAMAMVHSRVRRVFYGCDSTGGALGSKCKLHVNRQLNHRYLVFKGLMSDECKALEKYYRA